MGLKRYRGTRKQLERVREREANIGISKNDPAGRWLAEQPTKAEAPKRR